MTIHREQFGQLHDGRPVEKFTLEAASGLRARILSYGGTVTSLEVPDRTGHVADVALGFDDLATYLGAGGYLGGLIGRYANRIGGAQFSLDGALHRLTANEGANQLHGGTGFDKVLWTATPQSTPEGPALVLDYTSRDGEEGYPGNLSVRVVYSLQSSQLQIDYTATTDRDTIINLTNHLYWNLAGHDAGTILEHELVIDADRFAVVGPELIPTGELAAVTDTPFDFQRPRLIGARIDDDNEQLRIGKGYDHSFALTGTDGSLRRAARVRETTTGRILEVLTTEPAIQLYSGNHLGGMPGKAGAVYHPRTGFCLETQHHPDSPNQPSFPPTILRAGARYRTTTIYRFSNID